MRTQSLRATLALLVTVPASLLAQKLLVPGSPRPSLKDIVQARTIDGLSISPDGRWLAYRVITPSIRDNQVLAQWFAVSTGGNGSAVPVGPAAEPILIPEFDLLTEPEALWEADSSGFVTRMLRQSEIQLYAVERTGSWKQLTRDPADVQEVNVDADGKGLTYKTRAPRADIARLQKEQDEQGIHFDRGIYPEGLPLTHNFLVGQRWTTIRRSEPPEDTDIGTEAFAGALRSHHIAAPSGMATGPVPRDRAFLDPWDERGAARTLAAQGGSQIALRSSEEAAGSKYLTAEVRFRNGEIRTCQASICHGTFKALREVTLNPDTGEVVILYEKDFSARAGLFGWNPQTGVVRQISAPEGALTGGTNFGTGPCPRLGHLLFCVASGPTRPDHVIRIDLSSGTTSELADPNAELASRRFPSARFLEWHDAAGRPGNGVLMVPDGQTAPVPLVITTYRCRGLLRGGVAMVVPEPILAQRGFAALCVNNDDAALEEVGPDGKRLPAKGAEAALASYRAIIDQLAVEGIIDPHRVGISGHSFSANSVAFGISHSDLFSAAVMSGGTTMDPMAYPLTAPMPDSSRKEVFANLGLPAPASDPDGVWKAISPALNATSIHAPLLLQPPENEWLFTLQLYTAIRDTGGMADMYIYPHVGHDANRFPLQHLWRNRRSLDWFSYWLKGRSQRTLIEPTELKQWDALRLHQTPSRDD